MKHALTAAATFGLVWSGCVEARAGAAKPARVVQLISLSVDQGPKDGSPDVAEQERHVPRGEEAAEVGGFRVHDLSRRWVEFQMASSFGDSPEQQPAEPAMSQMDIGQQWEPSLAIDLPPAGSIAVPLWMRGGDAFASAALRYVPGCAQPGYRPTGFLRPEAENRRATYYGMMSSIACEYGVPVGLFDAMIIRESRYHPTIYSPKNAYGLTQLMPGTATALGVNRYNVEGNLRGGAKYLRAQLDRFGHYHLALAAYNAGPGRVRNGKVPQITETRDYVDNVLLNWSRLSGLNRRAVLVQEAPAPVARPQAVNGRRAAVSTF